MPAFSIDMGFRILRSCRLDLALLWRVPLNFQARLEVAWLPYRTDWRVDHGSDGRCICMAFRARKEGHMGELVRTVIAVFISTASGEHLSERAWTWSFTAKGRPQKEM